MVHDPVLGGVLLIGGHGANGTLGDTWLYDGTWRLLSATLPPRERATAAFHAGIGKTVVTGGHDGRWPQPQTFVLARGTAASSAYGNACGGTTVPQLLSFGLPTSTNLAFGFDVGRLQSGAPLATVLSSRSLHAPLPGCELLIDPAAILASFPAHASATGFAHLPLRVPTDARFSGAVLHAQSFALDSTSPFAGLAMTNGLTLTIGD